MSEPHHRFVAMSITMHGLELGSHLGCKLLQALPTFAMNLLITSQLSAIRSLSVDFVQLWCLQHKHQGLEMFQLLCTPLAALFCATVAFQESIELLRHISEV